MTQAHPLQWPHGRARTKSRKDSAFKVTPAQAFSEMMDEMTRFGARTLKALRDALEKFKERQDD